ncbi:MAG: S49 family peptidase [Alphaproteobacteria bacterium]|nr:S49 family peptidase [Alphaproteobacteria bacterium]
MPILHDIAGNLGRWLPIPGKKRALVAVIELRGVIGQPGMAVSRGLTFGKVESAIEAAFKPKAVSAVALSINSPGGSPVQSRLIFSAIRRAAERKKKPVFAFIEDVGASGGYILALAGDEIYADRSSIVGSIGVVAAGFGFPEAIARLGVERRVHVAGENKSQLDPFQPEKAEDVARLQAILDDLHSQFVDLVKDRRGARLSDDPDLFSGAFWPASGAKSRGLIDGIAHLGEFMRARFGDDVKLKKIPVERVPFYRRLLGGSASFDADGVIEALEARALWARFGL